MREEFIGTVILLLIAAFLVVGAASGIGSAIRSANNDSRLDAIEARLDAEAR